jgi:hypothetical protein
MFREGLQELGWTDGRNIQINIRWATGAEKIGRLAQELAASQPDVVLSSTTPTTEALLRQTRTIPIVFATVADPIGSGFVTSLPRPGGNTTGFTNIEGSVAGWVRLADQADRGCEKWKTPWTGGKAVQGIKALEVAGAMAREEVCRRWTLVRPVSHLPSFLSAHDWARRPCFGGMRAR